MNNKKKKKKKKKKKNHPQIKRNNKNLNRTIKDSVF